MKFLLTHKITIINSIFFIVLFALVSSLQEKYDDVTYVEKNSFTTETRYVMPAHLISKLSFGFNNVLADFYWISLIQDFSTWNGKDAYYLEQYRNISVLDPDFSYPYLLGILTFTARGTNYKETTGIYQASVETFEPIARIGMNNFPDNWEIPFYMGTAFQLNKVPDRAIPYLKIAADKPTSPESVKRAYDVYLKNILAGNDVSSSLIRIMYETTDSKTTKKIIENSILTKALSAALTAVSHDYKKKYGTYPTSIEALIAKKMVRRSTDLDNNYTVTINQKTGEVTVTSKKNI